MSMVHLTEKDVTGFLSGSPHHKLLGENNMKDESHAVLLIMNKYPISTLCYHLGYVI
ncbi:unnamed protein product [Phytomonas sp. EM1]|nr:unnamed protein product [Phytomonas sp. EM1]|eukprot:CCW63537.1 unnamed protein product [Phytomonas sp. isolate EM1]